jgi:hypothetical protein
MLTAQVRCEPVKVERDEYFSAHERAYSQVVLKIRALTGESRVGGLAPL